MSYQGTKWAVEVRGVNRGEKAILMQIGHGLDQRTNLARISVPQIAAGAEMSERQVRRILDQLEAPRSGHRAGVLKRIGGGVGKGNVSIYAFVGLPQKNLAASKGDIGDSQKGTLATAKGDIGDSAIRNIRTTRNQEGKQDDLDLELRKQLVSGKNQPVSSSENRDDDAGRSSRHHNADIERVVQAFEDNPLTTGKASAADLICAAKLLRQHSVENIVYGILLGSARKANSIVAAETEPHSEQYWNEGLGVTKIRSLAYFVDAILEVERDSNVNESYARYLQLVLTRFEGRYSGSGARKKTPQSVAS